MLRRFVLVVLLLLAFAGVALAEVKYIETTGELCEPAEKGQNYRLKVKLEGTDATHVFLLGFDDMYKRWPEIKQELPRLVGKQVVVTHREGFVEFGNVKALLARDIKLK